MPLSTPPHTSYTRVRSLARGLDLLGALNRMGAASPRELGAATGIDRATVYRLLETLRAEGYVAAPNSGGRYRLTLKIRELSDGLTDRDAVTDVVAPELGGLLANVLWPSDYAVFDAGAMRIRETTHPFSHFSVHRSVVGQPRPLLRSALGRAVLAAASPRLRNEMLAMVRSTGQIDAPEAADEVYVERLIADTNARGYAWHINTLGENISAIALPVLYGSEPIGSINIIFFQTAFTPEQAAAKFLPHLRDAVKIVERHLVNSSIGVA